MAFSKITVFTAVVAICISSPALAVPLVTYTWTTTSEGYGSHVDAPSLATFEAPLSDVLSGEIPYADISDIQLFYPGLTFNEAVTSSIGLDNVAYVDPTTGNFVYHSETQGLAVIAFVGSDINNATTFLSITVDNPISGAVADEFNAIDNGNPYAGYPTAGYWTATFPTGGPSAPESSTWAMMLAGFGGLGCATFLKARKAGVSIG